MLSGHRQKRVKISWLPIEMYCDNRARFLCYGICNQRGVDIVAPSVGLHWHRFGPHSRDGKPGCNERVGRNDNLIARFNFKRTQAQDQRVQPVGDANAVLCLAIGGKGLLEILDFRAKDIPTALQNARHCCIDFRAEFKISCAKVKKRDLGHMITESQSIPLLS